jgi:GNAT superfamily N-acetyltransferase
MSYELVIARRPEDLETYHSIRRAELFEARGRGGIYDRDHADERHPDHIPLLLRLDGVGIATTRLDLRGDGLAVVRLVAVTKSLQRRGHGRVLAGLTETFARQRGVIRLTVNAAVDAVGFYERMGFAREAWDPTELAGWNADSVQMTKSLLP